MAARSAYAAKNALGERCCLPICPGYRLESGSDHCPGLDSMGRTDTGHGRSPTGFCRSRQQRGGCGSHGNRRNRGRCGVLARLGHDCPRDGNEVVARKIQLLCPLSLTAQFANVDMLTPVLIDPKRPRSRLILGNVTMPRENRVTRGGDVQRRQIRRLENKGGRFMRSGRDASPERCARNPLWIAVPLCTMTATSTAGSSSPSTVLASSQALGLLPMIDRTVAAVATRSRQELMPLRA